jgi:hypothetical protein
MGDLIKPETEIRINNLENELLIVIKKLVEEIIK